jgi:aldehyde:ferredoxin oxidoreductase
MQGAFNRQLFRVDLTTGTTRAEDVPDPVSRMYLGGGAMAAYLQRL